MTFSIRSKIIVGTVLVLACGLLIARALTIRSLAQTEISRSSQMLKARANLVAFGLQPFSEQFTNTARTSSLQRVVRDLSESALARVTIVASDGRVVADSGILDDDLAAVENHLTRPEILAAISTGEGTDLRTSDTTQARTLYLAIPLPHLNTNTPEFFLRLGLPMATVDRGVDKLHEDLGLAFMVAFLIAIGLSIWLAQNITKPLLKIVEIAQKLATGTTHVHMPTGLDNEVGFLANALNSMTEQLQNTIATLSKERAELATILTAMVEGILVLDSQGHILVANPALEQMFQIAPIIGRDRFYFEVFKYSELHTLISEVLTNKPYVNPLIFYTQNERSIHIEVSSTQREGNNQKQSVFVFRDITKLHRLEKVRKDFVGNVSHELRTPLTSIKGYIEALLDGAMDNQEMRIKFLEIILKQSDRLTLILDDLLEISRLESGQVRFKQDPLNLQSIMQQALATIHPLATKKEHRLVTRMADVLPTVFSDPERLIQVLSNLLENANKYTPEKGVITLAAYPVSENAAQPSTFTGLELSVSDTGLGIPEEDRPRIFERFYRVDKARSRELGGTGLGLSIVKHIIEGLGGQVWAEAHNPSGSRFIIRLPLQYPPPPITET